PFVHGQGEHAPATVLPIGDRVTTEHARGDVVRVSLHVGRDLVDPVPVRASVGTGASHQCGGRSDPPDGRGGGGTEPSGVRYAVDTAQVESGEFFPGPFTRLAHRTDHEMVVVERYAGGPFPLTPDGEHIVVTQGDLELVVQVQSQAQRGETRAERGAGGRGSRCHVCGTRCGRRGHVSWRAAVYRSRWWRMARGRSERPRESGCQARSSASAAARASTGTMVAEGAPARAQSGSLRPLPVTVHTTRLPRGTCPASAAWSRPATLAAEASSTNTPSSAAK